MSSTFIPAAQDVKAGMHTIIQQYVGRPFLLDGFKFDLRLYVLITGCDPYSIFLYEGTTLPLRPILSRLSIHSPTRFWSVGPFPYGGLPCCR